jgi:hypothetical protein
MCEGWMEWRAFDCLVLDGILKSNRKRRAGIHQSPFRIFLICFPCFFFFFNFYFQDFQLGLTLII